MYLPVKSRDAEYIKLPADIDPIIGWLFHIMLKPHTPHVCSILTIDPVLNKAHAAHDGHDRKKL